MSAIPGGMKMANQPELNFTRATERWDFDCETVTFYGQDEDKQVRCTISGEALDDYAQQHSSGDGEKLLQVFRKNRTYIESKARRKYLAGLIEDDGSILIRTGEL